MIFKTPITTRGKFPSSREILVKLVRSLALVTMTVVFLAPTSVFAEEPATTRTLTLSTEPFPPISTADGQGFEDLLAKEIFRRAKIGLVLSLLPSERTLVSVNSGIVDGMLSRVGGMDQYFPNIVQFTEKTITREYVAFARSGTIEINDWSSLEQQHVAFLNGWKIFERNVTKAKSVVQVEKPDQLFAMLENGRVDIILYDRISGLQFIQDQGIKDIRPVGTPLARKDTFFYLNNKHEELIEPLSSILREIKADGSYQEIYDATIGRLLAKQ